MADLIDTLPLIWAFATLFVVIDPIGLAPIFVALTQGVEPQKRKAIGVRACTIAFVVLALFGFSANPFWALRASQCLPFRLPVALYCS